MSHRKLLVHVMLLVVCAAVFSVMAHAQYRASLQGTVTDAQGAVVPGAKITLTSKETGNARTVSSNAAGVYSINGLAPGSYGLTIERQGFKKKVLDNVQIGAELSQSVNVQLDLGQVTETITVTGDSSPLIDTETANISGTLTARQIQSLPTSGRDPFQLLRTAPGAFGEGSRENFGDNAGPGTTNPGSSIFQTENQVQVSANGMRVQSNAYQIDGVNVNSQAWGGAAVITPNEESIKEVKILVNNYSAENGRNAGAQVLVVSQNGTNQYHGSAFFKADRPGLNAYNRWNGPNNSPVRANDRFNQYGGSIGGPIIHNKLFAFFSYETQRNHSSSTGNDWYETPWFVQNAGPAGSIASKFLTFPGLAVSQNRVNPKTCADVSLVDTDDDPVLGNCHAISGQGLDIGRPLDPELFSLGTQDLSWHKPHPNQEDGNSQPGLGGDGTGSPSNLDGNADIFNVQTVNPNRNTAVQYNGRVDFQATSKDLVAFSTYWQPVDSHSYNGTIRPMNNYTNIRTNFSWTAIWQRTISPTMLNEARFNSAGWHWNEVDSNPQEPWGLVRDSIDCIQGICTPFDLFGPPGPSIFNQKFYNGRDVLTKVHKSHTLKFGGDIYRELFNDRAPWDTIPAYNFRNLWDFANDAPRSQGYPWGSGTTFNPQDGKPTEVNKQIRDNIYAFFVQDDWKIKSNLTINLGLRWEYFSAISDANNNLANPILGSGSGGLTDLKIKVGGDLYSPSKHNFGPQIGFAWSPRFVGNDKLVLRGGLGISYDEVERAPILDIRSNYPLIANINFSCPNPLPPCGSGSGIVYQTADDLHKWGGWPANPSAISAPDDNNLPVGGNPVSLAAVNQNLATPRSYHYSLEGQYDLGRNWVATIGYTGSQTRDYSRKVNLNWLRTPLNPRVFSLGYYTNDASASSNALLTQLQHRFSNSFSLDTQYRLSKVTDDSPHGYYGGEYPFDLKYFKGPANYDTRHAFKLIGVYSPVLFHGENGWLEKVVGGWTISGITTYRTGYPWTPKYGGGLTSCSLIYQGSGYCELRPASYLGGAGSDYGNDTFKKTGGNFPNGGTTYFTVPTFVPGAVFPDTSAIPQAPGVGRNSFRGPRFFSTDMTLSKSFGFPNMPVLGENARFEFRANFFNIFNQLNLKSIDTTISPDGAIENPHFGQAQGGYFGRTVELQARFSF